MPESRVMVSFSSNFLSHVHYLYLVALEERKSGKVLVYGINSYTSYGGPAYISSVAAVEAFLNEFMFYPMTKHFYKDAPLYRLDQKWLEQLDVRLKLVLIPQLLFNTSFDRSTQPYQDFDILVSVRNDFVHYKMHKGPPKYLKVLEDRSIALPHHEQAAIVWTDQLSSSEGIRWAHNTSCKVVQAFAQMVPEQHRNFLATFAMGFFEIGDSEAQKLVASSDLHTKAA
jgi:hypothetical protein